MMLDYLGEKKAAVKIETAVANVLKEGKFVTKDLNREKYVGTKEMTEAILKEIDRLG
ncbi:MAG TPA: isocitrate/isopropylmalate family dehydrogenase [Ignavibacteriales bacterium]|nr:isocitrate/isopropylmalate family dehydrogenase [Ignavibacteriales bacterium]